MSQWRAAEHANGPRVKAIGGSKQGDEEEASSVECDVGWPTKDQPPFCDWYANGVGISTWTVPSASVVMPRALVSWRSPEPSGRIAKICSPNGFAPTGSQLAWNRTVPLTCSAVVLRGVIPEPMARAVFLQPKVAGRPFHGRCVSWRRSPPRVLMEKSWQIWPGFS